MQQSSGRRLYKHGKYSKIFESERPLTSSYLVGPNNSYLFLLNICIWRSLRWYNLLLPVLIRQLILPNSSKVKTIFTQRKLFCLVCLSSWTGTLTDDYRVDKESKFITRVIEELMGKREFYASLYILNASFKWNGSYRITLLRVCESKS